MGLLGLAALLAIAPAAAAERVLGPSGSFHSVAVESLSSLGALPEVGTRLLYESQSSSEESMQSMVIPGTDESVVDSEPTILLSPLTFNPVIVWTRNEGTEAEINYSFYDGTNWSPATSLTANDFPDRHPQLFWGLSGYLHIVWTSSLTLDGPVMYEAVLDSKGVVFVPPTPVQSPPGSVVTTDSAAPATLVVSGALFAVDTSFKQIGRVTVQGGLDEPVPVNQRVDFILPAGSVVESARIEVVNGRILLLVKSGSWEYYSYSSPDMGWTSLHSIALDGVTDEWGAELMIKAMIEALEAP